MSVFCVGSFGKVVPSEAELTYYILIFVNHSVGFSGF